MKVASNKVGHMVDFYRSELRALYDDGELAALISAVFEFYLGYKKNEVYLRFEDKLNQSELLEIYDGCLSLKAGKPLQYVLGEAWFYGNRFYVDSRVLIPRPETEELVELILRNHHQCNTVLDIGTGSACIPIAIKKHLAECEVYACDVSSAALEVARLNVNLNQVAIKLFEADVLDEEVFASVLIPGFEVIVSNPPYITTSEKADMHQNVLDHEPHLALFASHVDDIIFYRAIIDLCKTKLIAGGSLYFELNPITSEKVQEYALNSNLFNEVELLKDLSGKIRFLRAKRK
jgi:release factor glutamine methyltransferase